MHILIAPDSFKESLSALEVATALQQGFSQVLPDASFDLMPVGDGGEGTVAALAYGLDLKEETTTVTGALGQPVEATYARASDLAVFEMATVCGLAQVPRNRRNPLYLTTRGVGELMLFLANTGVRRLMIGVGGSATNDGGIGMAAGLGYRFYDDVGTLLEPIGDNLGRITCFDNAQVPQSLFEMEITVITDVTNPLCGPTGATHVFAEQKGLPKSQFDRVDQNMKQFYELTNPAIFDLAGAGAGGGMAAGLVTFAAGKIVSGIDTVLDLLNFDQRVQTADLVLVGEGRMDAQSLSGKAPVGIARRVPRGIPVIAICGILKDDLPAFPTANIQAAFPIISNVDSLENTLAQASDNLSRTAQNIGNLINIYRSK